MTHKRIQSFLIIISLCTLQYFLWPILEGHLWSHYLIPLLGIIWIAARCEFVCSLVAISAFGALMAYGIKISEHRLSEQALHEAWGRLIVFFVVWTAVSALISSMRKSREKAEKAEEAMRAAVRARDDLLSVCSHELRTPVTGMKLRMEMALRNIEKGRTDIFEPVKVKKMITETDRQLDRLIRLIEEMLDFSRINSGKLILQRESCSLSELVAQTIDALKTQSEAVGCEVSAEIEQDVRAAVDRFRAEQAITNIVTNAIKYGDKKPVLVSLKKDGGNAVIMVKDKGPGIHEKDMDRIFEPYERAVSKTNISGLGLGLFITKQIVEAHGGEIYVESQPGNGSSFFIELPAQ